MRTSEKSVKLYTIQKVLTRATQNASFIKFEYFCQKLWAFKWNFGIFTTSTHQIWLNHVTPGANFENL